MSDFPHDRATTGQTAMHQRMNLRAEQASPQLRAALAPYLERHDGDRLGAVRELMIDLRFAAEADGADFEAAAEAALARFRPAAPSTGAGHD
jgi:hypothetical protein